MLNGLDYIGQILYIDLGYFKINLLQSLRDKGIFCSTSILRNNNAILKTDNMIITVGDVTIYKIQDRKIFNMISTIHDNNLQNLDSMPEILNEYNKYAKSLDHLNQTKCILLS